VTDIPDVTRGVECISDSTRHHSEARVWLGAVVDESEEVSVVPRHHNTNVERERDLVCSSLALEVDRPDDTVPVRSPNPTGPAVAGALQGLVDEAVDVATQSRLKLAGLTCHRPMLPRPMAM
jgi:hypothetical protein